MKNKIIIAFALASAFTVIAQDAGDRPGRPPGGPGGPGPRRPMPIMEALDTNKDGKIDATELQNAGANLAKLDKNGDGVLTPDELFGGPPPRGEGRGGPREDGQGGGGPRGPRGPRQQPQQ